MLQISELYIYPIKSLPGIAVKQALVTKKGFEHDRRWMLIDPHNRFISQREFAGLTQFKVSIEDDGLMVSHKEKEGSLFIPFKIPASGDLPVTIWDDTCTAQRVGDEADDWFTAMLGFRCRLVYMPEDTMRQVDENYAPPGAVTSFSDAYPFMMIGQSSLDDLNSRLAEALPVNRFRPNMVFTGGAPYKEDITGSFTIGNITFYGVKLCARCVIIAINQDNGLQEKEPTKTLASYRGKNNKVYFGQNLVHEGEGIISIGDELNITGLNTDERFIFNSPAEKSGAQ